MMRAKELLDTLPPKWDLRYLLPEDYEAQPKETDKGFKFDRRVTTMGDIANVFRVFTEGKVTNLLPDMQLKPSNIVADIKAATDSSCINNRTADTRAGAGIYATGGAELMISRRVPMSLTQSN